MYRVVFFDVDGTLLDTRATMAAAYGNACEVLGLDEDDYTNLYEYVGTSTSQMFSDKHGLSGDAFTQARQLYYDHFFNEGMKQVRFYDGMRQLLDDLKADGRVVAVATARNDWQIANMLEQIGMGDYFDHLAAAHEGKHKGGDKDEMLRECMQKIGASPDECIMIGDRRFDINGATKAGMHSIAVTFGFGSAEELSDECSPTYTAHNAQDIRKILWEHE